MREYNTESPKKDSKRFNSQRILNTLSLYDFNPIPCNDEKIITVIEHCLMAGQRIKQFSIPWPRNGVQSSLDVLYINCTVHKALNVFVLVYSVQLQQQFSRTSTSILQSFCKKKKNFFSIFFYFSKLEATIGVWWQGDEGSTSIIYVLIKKQL